MAAGPGWKPEKQLAHQTSAGQWSMLMFVFIKTSIAPKSLSPHPVKIFLIFSVPKIYDELVPFGPGFHNLTGSLKLSESRVEAKILVPHRPEAAGILGSV